MRRGREEGANTGTNKGGHAHITMSGVEGEKRGKAFSVCCLPSNRVGALLQSGHPKLAHSPSLFKSDFGGAGQWSGLLGQRL